MRIVIQTKIGLNWASNWNLRLNSLRSSRKTCFLDWRNEKVTWGVNERKRSKNENSKEQVYSKANVFNLSDWKSWSITWVKNAGKGRTFELTFSGNWN